MTIEAPLERAVSLAITFLREVPEDLRCAALMASADEQPRRARTLARSAKEAKELAGELGRGWSLAHGSDAQATKLVGSTLLGVDGLGQPGQPGQLLTTHRDGTALQMPTVTPPEVVAVLFEIAEALKLDTDTVWPITSLAREVQELAKDAVHVSEGDPRTITVVEVCDALGISSVERLSIGGEVEECPIDALTLKRKLRGVGEVLTVALRDTVIGTRVLFAEIELVEYGLTRKLAERLNEVDREWLEKLMGDAS